MGSARILRRYLKLDDDFPVPLSISHGVDMNNASSAMDVYGLEPVHWCYNRTIQERAVLVKPTINLPHPWLILKSERSIKMGSGVLVVGPPPGKTNDIELFRCLRDLNIHSYDLLLKFRGEVGSSQVFWESNGINVVTAGHPDELFYERLFEVLEKYETVIGCTLSSALFFAASIGRKCELLENYSFLAYDSPDYLKLVDFDAVVAKKFTRLLCLKKHESVSKMACEVLGAEYMLNSGSLKRVFNESLAAIQDPVFFRKPTNRCCRFLILSISVFLGKTGLIELGFLSILKRYFAMSRVALIKVNEIDIWLNGVNDVNLQIKEIPYRSGVTEPGWGVD